MELRNFIKESISSITNGIIDAQKELSDKNVIINPEKLATGKEGDKLLRNDGWRYIQELHFEIHIGIDEKNSDSGGGKLNVLNFASFNTGGINENTTRNSNVLKFSIPVAFPTTETPEQYKAKKRVVM